MITEKKLVKIGLFQYFVLQYVAKNIEMTIRDFYFIPHL
jgi:hypothetical protein